MWQVPPLTTLPAAETGDNRIPPDNKSVQHHLPSAVAMWHSAIPVQKLRTSDLVALYINRSIYESVLHG